MSSKSVSTVEEAFSTKPPSTPAVIEVEVAMLMPASYSEYLASLGFEHIIPSVRPGWVLVEFAGTLKHAEAIKLLNCTGREELPPEEEEEASEVLEHLQDGRSRKRRRPTTPAPSDSEGSDDEEKEKISVD